MGFCFPDLREFLPGFFGPLCFGEELYDALVGLDGGVSLLAVVVHPVCLIDEDEGSPVNLSAEFFERVGDACDACVDFVEAALFSLFFEDLVDEVNYGVGSGLEVL